MRDSLVLLHVWMHRNMVHEGVEECDKIVTMRQVIMCDNVASQRMHTRTHAHTHTLTHTQTHTHTHTRTHTPVVWWLGECIAALL